MNVKDILDRIETHGIAYFSKEQEDVIVAALRAYMPRDGDRRQHDTMNNSALERNKE